MALPKIVIEVVEPSVENGEARINAMAQIVTVDGVCGGGISVEYTGSENIQQLKTALVNAALEIATGLGYNLTANDVILEGIEKG